MAAAGEGGAVAGVFGRGEAARRRRGGRRRWRRRWERRAAVRGETRRRRRERGEDGKAAGRRTGSGGGGARARATGSAGPPRARRPAAARGVRAPHGVQWLGEGGDGFRPAGSDMSGAVVSGFLGLGGEETRTWTRRTYL